MKYRVHHTTVFDYKLPVISSHQVLRLKPRNVPNRQKVLNHAIKLSVAYSDSLELDDYFGNHLVEVRMHTRHNRLSIASDAEIDVSPRDEILLELSPPWTEVARQLAEPDNPEEWAAAQFCFASPHIDVLDAFEFAGQFAQQETSLLRLALNVTQTIFREFTYRGGVTDVRTDVRDVIKSRMGVCQDFAHLAIATLRSLGLATRYVSGYILSNPNGSELLGAEASHAWISVYCPKFGWVDFDPTNNQITSDQHITLGWGRDYADVAPTRGSILGGGTQKLSVDVSVQPLNN
jgi:transglutaminase-like putative cysteine protease